MSRIVSTGSYLPKNVATNDYFGKPNDPQALASIEKYMTGMQERRHASPEETGIYMAHQAAKACIDKSGYSPSDVDLIVGNITPNEYLAPEDLNLVSEELGCKRAIVLPFNTACSSFLTGLKLANLFLKEPHINLVLVINSTNWVNHIVDQTRDFSMFGDGAGCVLMDKAADSLKFMEEVSDTSVFHTMQMKSPVFSGTPEYFTVREDPKIDMIREQVLKPIDVCKKLLEKTNLTPDHFIAHQAGIGMLEYWMEKIGLEKKLLKHTFDKCANMMSANIPITLDHYIHTGEIKRGDLILFFSPAAGAHYISMLWEF